MFLGYCELNIGIRPNNPSKGGNVLPRDQIIAPGTVCFGFFFGPPALEGSLTLRIDVISMSENDHDHKPVVIGRRLIVRP